MFFALSRRTSHWRPRVASLLLSLAGLVLLVGGAGETLVEQGFGVHLCGGGVGFEGSAEEGGRCPAVEGEEWRVLVGNARNGDEGGIFGELFGDQDQGGRGSEAVELFIVGEIGEGLEQFGEAGRPAWRWRGLPRDRRAFRGGACGVPRNRGRSRRWRWWRRLPGLRSGPREPGATRGWLAAR